MWYIGTRKIDVAWSFMEFIYYNMLTKIQIRHLHYIEWLIVLQKWDTLLRGESRLEENNFRWKTQTSQGRGPGAVGEAAWLLGKSEIAGRAPLWHSSFKKQNVSSMITCKVLWGFSATRGTASSASDRQGSNFKSCVWRAKSSNSSHHLQEVLLAQFSPENYVHKIGLKPL